MKVSTGTLVEDLKHRTQEVLADANKLTQLSATELNAKPDADRWSALECLEHLNRYGDFYIPEINRVLNASQPERNSVFKSGVLGNYFAKMMLPGTKGMNTFKSMNPNYSGLRADVLEEFITQQEAMLDLLDRCANYDLTKIKTGITITNLIKLRLGDTLRVVIYHNQRHMEQAKYAIKLAKRELAS